MYEQANLNGNNLSEHTRFRLPALYEKSPDQATEIRRKPLDSRTNRTSHSSPRRTSLIRD